nr:hypothetical protein [Tanacetum cinerariifolium]
NAIGYSIFRCHPDLGVLQFNHLLKINVDVLTNDILGFNTYDDYKDAWIYEWNKDISWVANVPWLDYGPGIEPSDDNKHIYKLFRFKNGHAKWPTCNWKMEKYCNGELKDKALNSKSIFEGSKGVDEEPSDNARTHCSPNNEREDFERANHLGAYDEGCFDEHELIGDDDDDIDDLEDYLLRKDPPYSVNKEEERSKERRCKLLGIPYMKPPT